MAECAPEQGAAPQASRDCAAVSAASARHNSSQSLPAPLLVRLPIGDIEALGLALAPALDAHLWTFRDDSFLPHGTWREAEAREQPILLTLDGENPNGAAVRFLIDGAPMPTDADAYRRIVLIVDGDDPDAVAAARERWSEGKAKGLDVTYWQPDEEGRWQRLG